jgi:hypothetical protein
MPVTADIGTGSTLTFSGITVNLSRINPTGLSREAIDTSHLGTSGARSYLPGDTYDPGSISCDFHVDADTASTSFDLNAALTAAAGTFTVQMPTNTVATATGVKWTGNGFLTDVEWDLPFEELASGSFTLKATGAWTVVSGV